MIPGRHFWLASSGHPLSFPWTRARRSIFRPRRLCEGHAVATGNWSHGGNSVALRPSENRMADDLRAFHAQGLLRDAAGIAAPVQGL
jgi:hypothetical protein